MKTIATWIGFIMGVAALVTQFILTMTLRLGNGDGIFSALIFFFTFFTILTNLMLVLIYSSELWPREAMRWFRSPVTRGMMVASIVLVMVFYHFILAATWNPQGWNLACDIALHYVTPIFYVLWWVVFMRHGKLKFGDIPAMLLPPTVYLVWAMARGAVIGEYPYPVLEANRIGYGAVAINVLAVLVGLLLLCAIVVAVDKALTRVDMPGP
ncbi:MAG: Pr6Pr family membrane protein [Devosia sp.]